MKSKYNTVNMKRQLLTRIADHVLNDKPDRNIDMIPISMVEEMNRVFRCCRYRDRAILKYRLMAALGFTVEEETDELFTPAQYLKEASERTEAPRKPLTVIGEACSSCPGSGYTVSELCRGCVARPCETSCPRNAISVVNGHSVINQDKCIKCGKCAKVCPYGAVLRIPVPCEDSCPASAVSKDGTGRAVIDDGRCLSCGKCARACPFGAITDVSHLVDVLCHLKMGTPIAGFYAPSVAGQLPGSLGQINRGLKELGFSLVLETASGADITARREGVELNERLADGDAFMTTSCCPAWMAAVKKLLPQMSPLVSETPSPMETTAALIRAARPDMVTVFIGPCTAKKAEAAGSANVDYVLSFEELGTLLIAAGVDTAETGESEADTLPDLNQARREGRSFPVSKGVAAAVMLRMDDPAGVRPHCVNGLDARQLKLMKTWLKGKVPGNFIEVMACEGGCISGPGTICPPAVAEERVAKFAGEVYSASA